MDNIQQKYLRRAKIIAAILSLAPFARLVALSGSLPRNEATEKSDIDFFVLTKKSRLWSGRFFVTVLAELTGFRRKEEKIAGRICLNRYQTEDYLLIGPPNQKNAKDYANFQVIWASGGLKKQIYVANDWIQKRGYRFINQNIEQNFYERILIPFLSIFRYFFEFIYELILGEPMEQFLRGVQIKKILENPLTQISTGTEIFISDRELRFHPRKLRINVGLDKEK